MIACVVVNYNDGGQTKSFIERTSSFDIIDYFVVVDNNSCDDSLDILSPIVDNRIHLIKNQKNGGYGFGNNVGVNYALENLCCDYVIIANPDVYFDCNYVKCAYQLLQSNEKCIAVSGIQFDMEDIPVEQSGWYLPSPIELVFEYTILLGKLIKKRNCDISNKLCTTDCLAGALLMVNSKLFREIGGYDENMFLYYEETLLGIKTKSNGYCSIFSNELHYHHIHEKTINKNIPNVVEKVKIMLSSKECILRNYMKANFALIAFNSIISKTIVIETYIKCYIKGLLNGK